VLSTKNIRTVILVPAGVYPSEGWGWDKLQLGSSIKQFLLLVFYAFMQQLKLNLLLYFNLILNVHFNNYNENSCPGSQQEFIPAFAGTRMTVHWFITN